MSELQMVLDRLERIESVVSAIADKQRVQEFYDVDAFAKIVGRSSFTVREWCRHGRLNAKKKASGRGAFCSWTVAHSELLRYQAEGLLPIRD